MSKLFNVADQQAQALLKYVFELESEMEKHLFGNANINVVSNCDLPQCRHITDRIDQKFLRFWHVGHLWDEIQTFCDQAIKLRNNRQSG